MFLKKTGLENYYDNILLFLIILSWIGILVGLYNNNCDGCVAKKVNIFKQKKITEYMKPSFGSEECNGILGNDGCIIKQSLNELREKTTGFFSDNSFYR